MLFSAQSLVLAAAPVLPVQDPGVCESCYAASQEQTLPVVVASVVVVLAVKWWFGRRSRKSASV